MDETARAMIHDLIVAILEGRETTESEPVPRSINVAEFNRAIRKAIAAKNFVPPPHGRSLRQRMSRAAKRATAGKKGDL